MHIPATVRIPPFATDGFSGTPSFVIGDDLVPGFVGQDALELYVSEARTSN